MKILHLPESSLPWRTGGKEVYCHSLSLELAKAGVSNVVAIHRSAIPDLAAGVYAHEGIPVHVLPDLPGHHSRHASYAKTFPEIPGFADLLDEVAPDLVHFHDQGGGASLSHLREVKRRGIPAIITIHSPGQTCPQRELLRYGEVPCDGEVRLGRCTACRLTVSGVPRAAAHLLALAECPGVPESPKSRLARALTGRRMTRLFRDSLDEFFHLSDGLVVLADWSREVMLRNGAAPEKVHLIRTGGPDPLPSPAPPRSDGGSPLRLVCLGRATRIKGMHVLVEAVKLLPPAVAVEVHFLGPYWETEPYGLELMARTKNDSRFRQPRLVPPGELPEVVAAMDLVIVPSLWLETGPLTVFDALAAGVPVAGSRLGGIAELITDGVNGWLFEAGDAGALSELILRAVREPESLARLRKDLRPLRTMREVASDYSSLYHELTDATVISRP